MPIELLEPLVGNGTGARVLLYIQNYGDGYAAGIARTFGLSKSQVMKQLDRFERGGILVQRPYGRTRVYQFNPRYALRKELQALLERALALTAEGESERYFTERRRPRLKGKSYELVEN